MYRVLVYIHILSAMAWVGGGFALVLLERRAHQLGGPPRLGRLMADNEWLDRWVFTPAPLLVVASGVTMIVLNDAWAFSQVWVWLALILIVTEFAVGYRDYRRVNESRESGVDTAEFADAVQGYLRMSPIAIGLLATVVLLMVFKPGA